MNMSQSTSSWLRYSVLRLVRAMLMHIMRLQFIARDGTAKRDGDVGAVCKHSVAVHSGANVTRSVELEGIQRLFAYDALEKT